jgi:hypothetical protein
LRLDATSPSGTVDAAVDLRSRRTTRAHADGTIESDALGRLYRASLAIHDAAGRRRITVGRQLSAQLAPVSLFDGGLLELAVGRTTVGLFGGTQPAPIRMRFATDVVEEGAFVELHQAPLATRRWSAVLGGVASQQEGQPNRQFLFASGYWLSPGLMASLTQEVDYRAGWQRAWGDPTLSLTSTFATARVQVRPWLAVNGGYDGRRSVRLYRDRVTPETDFDDAYRQGAWAGASVEALRRLRFSADARFQGGEGLDGTVVQSWTAEAWRLPPLNVTARVRGSRYDGGPLESRLLVASLGGDPLLFAHLEVGAGTRETRDAVTGVLDQERWWDTSLDLSLWRHWYVAGSYEEDRGTFGETRQVYANLSCRF